MSDSQPTRPLDPDLMRVLERHAEQTLGPRWREDWVGIDRLGSDGTMSVAPWEGSARVADAGSHTLILAAFHDDDALLIRRIKDGSNRYWILRGNRLYGPLHVGEFPHAGEWSDIAEKRWVRLTLGDDRRVADLTLAPRPTDGWYAANP